MSSPKLGLLTNPSIEILKEITNIHKLGFDYPEIAIEGPKSNLRAISNNLSKIRHLFNNLKVSRNPVHTIPWIDLGSDSEPIRQAWIWEAMREIETARVLRSPVITFHPNVNGMFFGKARKIIIENWISSLNEIVEFGTKLNVKIALENLPASQNGIHKLDEFKYIIDNVPGLNVHLDIAHAFTSGGMPAVINYIKTFQDEIMHIYWHDNDGKSDQHLAIGEGLIDHRKVIEDLKKFKYERAITLEVFTNKKDAKSSANELKRLMYSC